MSVVRSNPKEFVVIPRATIQSTDLGLQEKGLLAFMLSFPDKWQFSVSHLDKEINESQYVIRKILQRLKNKGYVMMERKRTGGTFGKIDYVVYDQVDNKGKPIVDTDMGNKSWRG